MSRRIVILIGLAAVVLIAVAVCGVIWADRIPGTLRRDAHGNAVGTGQKTYRNASGAVMLVEEYVDGKQVRSEWFRPDGASILVTEWKGGSGVGLHLRQDGSIKNRMTYVKGIAEGPATYYARDGSVLGEAIFKDGQRVGGYEPKPGGD